MSEDLELQLLRVRADLAAARQCMEETNRKFVQVTAELQYTKSVAEKHLRRAGETIDALHLRLDAMCDEWQAQISSREDIGECEKASLMELVEPFRPKRLGSAEVADTPDGVRADPPPPAPPQISP